MNRKLTLLLPLALMAACSQTPAPAGTGGDDVAPAAAKAAAIAAPIPRAPPVTMPLLPASSPLIGASISPLRRPPY